MQREEIEDTTHSSKEKIHQEDIAVLNIYAPNTRRPKFINKIPQFKSHMDPYSLIVGEFNTTLSPMYRPSQP